MGKTRTVEPRKGAAPDSFFSIFVGAVNAEAAFELNLSIPFLFTL